MKESSFIYVYFMKALTSTLQQCKQDLPICNRIYTALFAKHCKFLFLHIVAKKHILKFRWWPMRIQNKTSFQHVPSLFTSGETYEKLAKQSSIWCFRSFCGDSLYVDFCCLNHTRLQTVFVFIFYSVRCRQDYECRDTAY